MAPVNKANMYSVYVSVLYRLFTLIRVTSTSTRPIASFPSTSSPMAQQKESPLFPDDSGLINPLVYLLTRNIIYSLYMSIQRSNEVPVRLIILLITLRLQLQIKKVCVQLKHCSFGVKQHPGTLYPRATLTIK
jgi:hypothetical protein